MRLLKPSGYGGLPLRMRFYGKKWLFLNMIQTGSVGGVKRALLLMGSGVANLSFSTLNFFKSSVHFEVGNGAKVLFWQDKWCGDQPLKAHFPNFFRMASSREATVQEICLGMGVSISEKSLLLESQMIGKRKAFLICCFFLQIRK